MEIEDKIRLLITDSGLTSAQFADKTKIQKSTVSHILSGRNKPSYEVIHKILVAFPNINTDWLLRNSTDMYIDKEKSIFAGVTNVTKPIFSPDETIKQSESDSVTNVTKSEPVSFQKKSVLSEIETQDTNVTKQESTFSSNQIKEQQVENKTEVENIIATEKISDTKTAEKVLPPEDKNQSSSNDLSSENTKTQEDSKESKKEKKKKKRKEKKAQQKKMKMLQNQDENTELLPGIKVSSDRIIIFNKDRTYKEYFPA